MKDHPDCDAADRLPWKKIAIFNVLGFLDFYTQFIADEFRKMGTESRIHSFNFPALEYLRKNPTEMRSVNIARMFEKQENLDELATLLKREAGEVEAIVLPAVFGLNQHTALDYLQNLSLAYSASFCPGDPYTAAITQMFPASRRCIYARGYRFAGRTGRESD